MESVWSAQLALRAKLALRARLTLRVRSTLRGTLVLRAKLNVRVKLPLRDTPARDGHRGSFPREWDECLDQRSILPGS